MNYYNDFDQHAAQWLKNLIAAGLIPPGIVDSRPIQEVTPNDLTGFTQCHFFAGIGGWSVALTIAGWSPTEPVWTGSCPCQPFSVAGKQRGTADERHLWPEFRRLIADCKPPRVFGEQVASKDGRTWLSGVRNDLERVGYAVGSADLCAAGVGAPHIRQRLWWVADSGTQGKSRWGIQGPDESVSAVFGATQQRSTGCSTDSRLGHADRSGCGELRGAVTVRAEQPATELSGCYSHPWSDYEWIPCADGKARRIEPGLMPLVNGLPGRVGLIRGFGNAIVPQVAAEFIRAYMECRP